MSASHWWESTPSCTTPISPWWRRCTTQVPANDAVVEIAWIDSEELTEQNLEASLRGCGGILVPGGFESGGSRE